MFNGTFPPPFVPQLNSNNPYRMNEHSEVPTTGLYHGYSAVEPKSNPRREGMRSGNPNSLYSPTMALKVIRDGDSILALSQPERLRRAARQARSFGDLNRGSDENSSKSPPVVLNPEMDTTDYRMGFPPVVVRPRFVRQNASPTNYFAVSAPDAALVPTTGFTAPDAPLPRKITTLRKPAIMQDSVAMNYFSAAAPDNVPLHTTGWTPTDAPPPALPKQPRQPRIEPQRTIARHLGEGNLTMVSATEAGGLLIRRGSELNLPPPQIPVGTLRHSQSLKNVVKNDFIAAAAKEDSIKPASLEKTNAEFLLRLRGVDRMLAGKKVANLLSNRIESGLQKTMEDIAANGDLGQLFSFRSATFDAVEVLKKEVDATAGDDSSKREVPKSQPSREDEIYDITENVAQPCEIWPELARKYRAKRHPKMAYVYDTYHGTQDCEEREEQSKAQVTEPTHATSASDLASALHPCRQLRPGVQASIFWSNRTDEYQPLTAKTESWAAIAGREWPTDEDDATENENLYSEQQSNFGPSKMRMDRRDAILTVPNTYPELLKRESRGGPHQRTLGCSSRPRKMKATQKNPCDLEPESESVEEQYEKRLRELERRRMASANAQIGRVEGHNTDCPCYFCEAALKSFECHSTPDFEREFEIQNPFFARASEAQAAAPITTEEPYEIQREEPLQLTLKYPVLVLRPASNAVSTQTTLKENETKAVDTNAEMPKKKKAHRGRRGGKKHRQQALQVFPSCSDEDSSGDENNDVQPSKPIEPSYFPTRDQIDQMLTRTAPRRGLRKNGIFSQMTEATKPQRELRAHERDIARERKEREEYERNAKLAEEREQMHQKSGASNAKSMEQKPAKKAASQTGPSGSGPINADVWDSHAHTNADRMVERGERHYRLRLAEVSAAREKAAQEKAAQENAAKEKSARENNQRETLEHQAWVKQISSDTGIPLKRLPCIPIQHEDEQISSMPNPYFSELNIGGIRPSHYNMSSFAREFFGNGSADNEVEENSSAIEPKAEDAEAGEIPTNELAQCEEGVEVEHIEDVEDDEWSEVEVESEEEACVSLMVQDGFELL